MDTRAAAANVIAKLLRQQGSLATSLPDVQALVPSSEQGLLHELCYGCARWYPRLHCIAQTLLDKPLRNKDSDVYALVLIGLYQLIFLRTPSHAAVNTCVEAAKKLKKPWAAGLVNGVLRQYQRDADAIQQRLTTQKEFHFVHPRWLLDVFDEAWPQHIEQICEANNAHPPFTLRVNCQKVSRDHYLETLKANNIEADACQFSADGVVLKKPTPVEAVPGFSEGWISVQDEAPQLCAELLSLEPGLRVLDACCAPGGKTTHIAERQPDLKLLMGLDISEARVRRTQENFARLGLQARLCVGDATQPDTWLDSETAQAGFDRILLDAPCSATGIIRRQPDIKMLRTLEQVEKLQHTQQALLNALWPLLQPGGLLLYATCSILPAENEQTIERFLASTSDAQSQAILADWGQAQVYGRQLLPQVGGHDGFYYAVLRKNA